MTERLYLCSRADLGEGRRAAQLIHASQTWAERHGPHHGTVIVYIAPDEHGLIGCLPKSGRSVVWREPDLHDQVTAWASDAGRQELPLLGNNKGGAPPT